ncbi:D-alanine--D-alanine ligase family protein [Jannaschia aquimarina]|uniref:DdlB_1 protein n=1 Tax=Jannaschia aquimarina TaxID=935700 RepID=A0A0D1ENN3_9RHOB|nr:hypothetical protein [Jannaschia aquimarina]KIT17265.1 D-alanine--D-alanine ligase B [Jannaschia aquimarina]SNT19310.1 D-alanine-D-alanine ligase [Jannaschia aquimarina]
MHVLHLVGATTTRFYYDLSRTYQDRCVAPFGTRASVLTVAPDGAMTWAGQGQDPFPCNLADVAQRARGIDVVVPHMFCQAGMTTWRALFEDVMGVPVVGPNAASIHVATSKWQTKALARSVGVDTPEARRLTTTDVAPPSRLPVIVKPDGEDNSIGLTLVRDRADWPGALRKALDAAPVALVEDYVPGREVRVGVIEDHGAPRVLPILEYHVTPDRPIRERSDKVVVDATGAVTTKSWEQPSLRTSCPAHLAALTRDDLHHAAIAMHAALGARDYSLFDFRIDEAGKPWLLEACIFWTFSQISVITRMLEAEGSDLARTSMAVWANAASRKRAVQVAAE